jgi:hypothetical protein
MQELIEKVEQWHVDRNLIDGANDKDQVLKLLQEMGELSDNSPISCSSFNTWSLSFAPSIKFLSTCHCSTFSISSCITIFLLHVVVF